MPDKKSSGFFNETPDPIQSPGHPVSMLRFLGSAMFSFRKRLGKRQHSAKSFAQRLAKYTGEDSVICRNRIIDAENGDPKVAFEVYAGYFFEMDIMPDLLKATCKGKPMPLQLVLAIDKDLPHYLRTMEIRDPADAEETLDE